MFQAEHPSDLSPDIFTHYFSYHSKENLIFVSDTQNNIQLPEHGKLTIPMANNYLFRALLPQNNKVLTGLIASLLHLFPSEISSVEITIPIVLGESINDKTFFPVHQKISSDTLTLNDCFICKAEERGVAGATSIDDNAADEKSAKSRCQLFIIRCTRS